MMIKLFEKEDHKNIMFNDLSTGLMVQANQHLVVNGGEAILLEPGGHKVYTSLLSEVAREVPLKGLKHIFLSHQDPDIIAAANGWLMVTEATAYLPSLWIRFIPHFGIDEYVSQRVKPIPDEGMILELNGKPLKIIPAHFLHSSGNFQVYDPTSKILYSGDLGASLGQDYHTVENFEDHVQYMEGFHKRYMPSTKALKMWVKMVKTLDVEIIAPQHGAIFPNRSLAEKFIDWVDSLECGADLMGDEFVVPK
jgi:flavorubredoxin